MNIRKQTLPLLLRSFHTYRGTHYAIFVCGKPPPSVERKHGNYGELFVKLLKNPSKNEKWDIFNVFEDKWPSLISQYHGCAITGSASSAHDRDGWMRKLESLLVNMSMDGKKIFGACFGHQLLANAFSGKSFRLTEKIGWQLGVQDIHLSKNFMSHYGSLLNLNPTLKVLKLHHDHVSVLPKDAEIIANSPNVDVEMFTMKDNIFAMQCHPEFSNQILSEIITIRRDKGMFSNSVSEKALESLEKYTPDSEKLKTLARYFLKGEL